MKKKWGENYNKYQKQWRNKKLRQKEVNVCKM